MNLHIAIVERELLVCTSLQRLLSATPGMKVTGTAGSVKAAEQLPATTPADIVLAGADLPDMDGTEGIRRLLTRFLSARVVMLAADAEPRFLIAALRAGADGCLLRDIMPEGLIRALCAVHQGEVAMPRNLVRLPVEALRCGTRLLLDKDGIERLSPREREVLTELSYGRSNAEIGLRLGMSENTVKTHVSNILRKTGSRSRFELHTLLAP